MRALGLMSGTSLDGIDVAWLDTDGADMLEPGPTGFFPYADHERSLLRDALTAGAALSDRLARPGILAPAEDLVTRLHGTAVEHFLRDHGLKPRDIDVVGFHGQTVLHRPKQGLTVQIGYGAELARLTGLDVIADFRAADVAAGGQGAPLVPAFHRALASAARLSMPAVLLNVGGVANITFLSDGDADPVACDTGPGNALIDDLMLERTGVAVDRDGATAARGQVHEAELREMLAHPFFALPAPKSLDRNAWSRGPVAHLATEDAAATLTAFTAAGVAEAIKRLPRAPGRIIVCGGGARNPTLMRELAARLPCRVADAAAFGWSGDAIEAQAFAYLAVRSRRGLPLSFPGTTGVRKPTQGGVYHPADRPRRARSAAVGA